MRFADDRWRQFLAARIGSGPDIADFEIVGRHERQAVPTWRYQQAMDQGSAVPDRELGELIGCEEAQPVEQPPDEIHRGARSARG